MKTRFIIVSRIYHFAMIIASNSCQTERQALPWANFFFYSQYSTLENVHLGQISKINKNSVNIFPSFITPQKL